MTNPYPADDTPMMAPDRTQVEMWLRVLTLSSELLRDARATMGRDAFSEVNQSDLDHDKDERTAHNPGVLPLSAAEQQQWATADTAEERRVTGSSDEVVVRVGPLGNGRWAMHATISPLGGDQTPTSAVALNCPTEHHARTLADQVLTAGPDPALLDRMARAGADTGARHTEATSRVREPEHERVARTRDAIRQAWAPPLAERVIAAEGFHTFTRRLHELEERGAALPDVLGRMSQTALSKPTVRDPARLAGWMCQNMLTVIDGQLVPDNPAPHPAAATRDVPTQARTPRTEGPAPAADEQQWLRDNTEDIVWPALRDALPEQLHDTLRASLGYGSLAADLSAKHATGWSLDALLTQLPTDPISAATDPARYLAAIVDNRAARTAPPRPGIDKVAMAAIVRDTMPAEVAEKVLGCPAWPALAKTMAQAMNPAASPDPELAESSVRQILAGLPTASVERARKPAAYAARLLRERAVARGLGPVGTTTSSYQPPDLTLTDRNVVTDITQTVPATPDLTGPTVSSPAATITVGDAAGAPTHQHAADEATREAARDEHSADYNHNTAADPDNPALAQDAEGVARVDDNLAAGYRATAAEERGAANAAALRAEAVFTPPSPATTRQGSPTAQQLRSGQARMRLRTPATTLDRTR